MIQPVGCNNIVIPAIAAPGPVASPAQFQDVANAFEYKHRVKRARTTNGAIVTAVDEVNADLFYHKVVADHIGPPLNPAVVAACMPIITAALTPVNDSLAYLTVKIDNMEKKKANRRAGGNDHLEELGKEIVGHPDGTGYNAQIGDLPSAHRVFYPASVDEAIAITGARIRNLQLFYNNNFGSNPHDTDDVKRSQFLKFVGIIQR
eukprot:TRINITY_DN8311_c0_g1_i1.p1 TRINITY_DN8311_c0_g1~~TRINITY_DN8311_c0_g1_i1.p1  ORF type:complete len:205 (-),score=9.46 TRINITY_DN8311_c0_g1_i1:75-689(-)